MAVHNNIFCDGCGVTPIVGRRFRCGICDYFDLCDTCHTATPHPHQMFEITEVLGDEEFSEQQAARMAKMLNDFFRLNICHGGDDLITVKGFDMDLFVHFLANMFKRGGKQLIPNTNAAAAAQHIDCYPSLSRQQQNSCEQ